MIHDGSIFPHRSRVEVFFLSLFLLWIYHLKKKKIDSVVIYDIFFIQSFIPLIPFFRLFFKCDYFTLKKTHLLV